MCKNTSRIYFNVCRFYMDWVMPVLVFIMRFWMARIFWYSGMSKVADWDSTLWLFQHEYKTPFLPYELTAYFATGFELLCPILLLGGLATRLATLPMLAMTAVIQFTYLNSDLHGYWAMLLCTILFFGPGYLSLDAAIKKYCDNRA